MNANEVVGFRDEETCYGINGEKVGMVVREGEEWVSYNLSDIEVYRGPSCLLASWTLQDRA